MGRLNTNQKRRKRLRRRRERDKRWLAKGKVNSGFYLVTSYRRMVKLFGGSSVEAGIAAEAYKFLEGGGTDLQVTLVMPKEDNDGGEEKKIETKT